MMELELAWEGMPSLLSVSAPLKLVVISGREDVRACLAIIKNNRVSVPMGILRDALRRYR